MKTTIKNNKCLDLSHRIYQPLFFQPLLFQLLISILLMVMFWCTPLLASAKPVFTATEQAWIDEHPTVTFGASDNWFPFEVFDGYHDYQGLSLDYLQKISDATGIEFKAVPLTWQEMMDKTKEGDIDLLLIMAKKSGRENFFKFSQSYAKSDLYFFSKLNFSAPDDLSGVTIALVKGYAINPMVTQRHPNATFIEVDDWLEGLELVQSGKADMFVEAYTGVNAYLNKHEINNITPYLPRLLNYRFNYHMATGNDNAPLISIIDKSLDDMSEVEKQKIDNKWYPNVLSMNGNGNRNEQNKIVYTSREQQWLNEHPTITYSGSTDWLPLGYYNAHGEYDGVIKVFLQNITNALEGNTFDYVTTEVVKNTLSKMEKDEIQLIPATLLNGKLDDYLLTDSIISTPIVINMTDKQIAYIDGLNDLKGKKIAVQKKLLNLTKLSKIYPECNFIATDSLQEALEGVSSGAYDANLATAFTTKHLLIEQALNNVRTVGSADIRFDINLAVHKRNAPLVDIFNKLNAKMDSNQRKDILEKWGQDNSKSRLNYALLFWCSIIFGVLFLLIWLWNRALSAEVEQRKEEVELRKKSEKKLKSSNHRLELATDTVGLVVWEVLFPKNITQERLTLDSHELDEIQVYDVKGIFGESDSNIQTEDDKSENDNLKNNMLTLRDWLVNAIDKESILHHLNEVRITKKKRLLEVELYDRLRVYDNTSNARKTLFCSISYDDSQEREKIIGTKWDITKKKITYKGH